MSIFDIRDSLKKLDLSMKWVQDSVPGLRESWRYYHFRELIQAFFDNAIDLEKSLMPSDALSPLLEALHGARVLNRIHEKFSDRKDKLFLDKLRESTLGPQFPAKERVKLWSKTEGSFGRNIESELLLASCFKNPKIVSFDSADFTVDLPSGKFGLEVKRVQSPAQLVANYLKACKQIEKNSKIKYGAVVFRFDRLVYSNQKSGIVLLSPYIEPKKWVSFRLKRMEEIKPFTSFQFHSFKNDYHQLLKAETKKGGFKKVWGYWFHFMMPFVVGNPMTLTNAENSSFVVWKANLPERIKFQDELMEEVEGAHNHSSLYSPLILPHRWE